MQLVLRILGRVAVVLATISLSFQGATGEELTYTAAFADGTYVTEGRLTNWQETTAHPNIGGKELLAPAAPVRWLVCNSLPQASPPVAYVEFVGGDRFPCRVLEHRHGLENWEERLPPHLLVKPSILIDLPGHPDRQRVGIKTDCLTRVVWQRRENQQYRPGTLYFLDGREVAFRALRWSNHAVLLLLKEGTRRVPFGEIAEIHLPRPDTWEAYFDTIAELAPDGTTRLLQAASTQGLIATTSLTRFRATAFSPDPGSWYHLLHPAWSLDAFWVQHSTIRSRRLYLPQEVPLSLIAPARVVRKAMLSNGWDWQIDRNVRGEALRNGGRQFGWGIGTQARCELTYPLSTACKSFRSWVGLDEAVGRGGCARAMLYVGSVAGRPLWESPTLMGSEQLVDTGALILSEPAAEKKSLVLVSDMADSNRPPGSDPFDIRDMVDWLEPQLELDPAKLEATIAARQVKLIPAFADWKVTHPPGARLLVTTRMDPSRLPEDAKARREVVSVGGPLTVSRTWTVAPEQKYLVLGIFRFGQFSEPSEIEVHINGSLVTDFQVPELTRDIQARPFLLPLERYVGQEITVDVIHTATDENGCIDWRSLETAATTTPTEWLPLEVVELKTRSGTALEKQYDGSIVANGDPPATETYTIVGDTRLQGITAVRLDAIPDLRFPRGGTGRDRDGILELHDVKLSAAPIDQPKQGLKVPLDHAWSDHELDAEHPAQNAVDADPKSCWATWPLAQQPHAIVFGPRHDIGVPGGTRLTATLSFLGNRSSAGRFRLSVCSQPRPIPIELPANILPYKYMGNVRILFDESEAWLSALQGEARLAPVADAYSGNMAIRVAAGFRGSTQLPDVGIPIRKNPGPGEARYLRWAWKKRGGESIGLQIAHDGRWGVVEERKFAYQAGPSPENAGITVVVDEQLPTEWTVVTRDLAEDQGEFTLTGLNLIASDGEFGLFDTILLAPSVADLDGFQPVNQK